MKVNVRVNGELGGRGAGDLTKQEALELFHPKEGDYTLKMQSSELWLGWPAGSDEEEHTEPELSVVSINGVLWLKSNLPFFSTGAVAAGGTGQGGGGGGGGGTTVYWGQYNAGYRPLIVDGDEDTTADHHDVAVKGHTHAWSEITSKPSFGTVITYNAESSISSILSNNIPTSAAVALYIENKMSGVSRYLGVSSAPLTDGGDEHPIINGVRVIDINTGDIVAYAGDEFLYDTNRKWRKFGDDTSWVPKTTQITAGNGLSGGGQLNGNVSIAIDSTAWQYILDGERVSGYFDANNYLKLANSPYRNAGSNTLPIYFNSSAAASTIIALNLSSQSDSYVHLGTSGYFKTGSSGKFTFGTNTAATGGEESKLVWDATNYAWKLVGNFYATGWVSAGGKDTSGGGGGGAGTIATIKVDGTSYSPPASSTVVDISAAIPLKGVKVNGNVLSIDSSKHVNIDLSGYATTSAVNTALAGYLPLIAGSSNPLTGTLYAQTIVPKNTTTTYTLGSSANYWASVYLANGGKIYSVGVEILTVNNTGTYRLTCNHRALFDNSIDIGANILPYGSGTHSIGQSESRWDNLYLKGDIYTTATASNVSSAKACRWYVTGPAVALEAYTNLVAFHLPTYHKGNILVHGSITDGTLNIGSESNRWNNIYVKRWYPTSNNSYYIDFNQPSSGTPYFRIHGAGLAVDSFVAAGGTVSASSEITVNASLIPTQHNTYSLGDASHYFKDLYVTTIGAAAEAVTQIYVDSIGSSAYKVSYIYAENIVCDDITVAGEQVTWDWLASYTPTAGGTPITDTAYMSAVFAALDKMVSGKVKTIVVNASNYSVRYHIVSAKVSNDTDYNIYFGNGLRLSAEENASQTAVMYLEYYNAW